MFYFLNKHLIVRHTGVKMKIVKILMICFTLSQFVNCGTLLNSLEPTKGIHGYDNAGAIYTSTVRSEDITPDLGGKKGEACQSQALYLFAWGDASLPTAMRSGAMTKVKHVSYERMRILHTPFTAYIPLFSKDWIIASGD